MSSPKISIIIPVYNAETTISNIVDKLITQEYQNIEIILVNDGSQDKSLAILRNFSRKDNRVLVLTQENKGVGAARNVGIKNASGEFIMFVDADDDLEDGLVLEMADVTTDNSDLVMCGMTTNGRQFIAPDALIIGAGNITQYALRSLLLSNLLYGPYCKLFRRKIVIDNNIQFPIGVKYGEDTIFVLGFLQHATAIVNIQKVLYHYDFHPGGLALSNAANPSYRKARADALRSFAFRKKITLREFIIYRILRVRWALAYAKQLLRASNV